MSDNDNARTLIPNKFLCRPCGHCGKYLRPDGLVDCLASGLSVNPVLRKDYPRYEDCPRRAEGGALPQPKLILLAAYARRVKAREDDPEQAMARVMATDQFIREDLKITAHIRASK